MVAKEEQQFIRFSIVERFYVADNNKTCLRLRVKYSIFLSYFKLNWFLCTDMHRSTQYEIRSNAVVGSLVYICGRTDGRLERQEKANRRFLQLC
jgi:hypothetical protein